MKLAILGASGHGEVVADAAELLGFEISFYDDSYPSKSRVGVWIVNGTSKDLVKDQSKFNGAIVAIGDNQVRKSKIEYLKEKGLTLQTLIHPSSIVSRRANVKSGTVILAGSVVNSSAYIGEGCIINSNATIEHDCVIREFSHISPSVAIAGGAKISASVWVGIGSCTKQLIEIGDNSIIGAGSNVLKNIEPNVLAYGNPAKKIKEL